MYGHTSRVWKIREISGIQEQSMILASACEDTTCKIWEVPSEYF
jgi:hypothetical protein